MGVALHGWLQRNSAGEEPPPTPVSAPPPGSEGVSDSISRGPGARLRPPAPVTFPQKPGALAGRPQVVPPMPTAIRKDLSRMASSENHAAITAPEPPAPSPAPLAPQPEPPAQEMTRPELDPTVRVPAITAPPQTESTPRPGPRLGGPRPSLPTASAEGLPPAYPPSAETERLAPPVARPVQVPSNSGQLNRLSAGPEALDAPVPPRPPLDAPLPPPLPPVPDSMDAPLPPPLPWDRSKAPAPPPDTENNWSEPPEEAFKLKPPVVEAPAPPDVAAPRPPVAQEAWDAPVPPPLKLALERAEPAPTPADTLPPTAGADPWAAPVEATVPVEAAGPESVPEAPPELEELEGAVPEGEPESPRPKKGALPMPLMVMLALSAVIVIGFSAGRALLGKGQPTPTASRSEVATPTWTPPPPPPPPPPATATPVFAPVTPSASPSPEASATAEVSPSASPSASESPDLALVNPDEEETPDESVVLPDPPTPAVQEDQSIKIDVPDLGLSFQVPPGMELKRNNWGLQKADLHWRKTEAWGESRLNVRLRIGKSGVRLRSSAEGLLNHQWTSVAHEGPDQVNLFRPDGRGVAWFGQYKRDDGNQVFITITYSWDGNLPKEGFEQASGEVRRRITLPQ